MAKKLTITVSDEVYEGLYARVGPRRIGKCVEHLVREDLRPRDLAAEYAEAAKDEEAEAEAREWIESGVGDCLPDEDFSDWPGYPSR
jgi:hypothetical protein